MNRLNITIDQLTATTLRQYGGGNLSQGIRRAAELVRDQRAGQDQPVLPPGCQCPPDEWGFDVKPVCANYADDGRGQCLNCEHDEECHV